MSEKLGPTPGGLTNESRTSLHEQLCNTPAQQEAKSEQPTSDTPRTDAFLTAPEGPDFNLLWEDFTRQLERELAAAKAENEALKRDVDMKMRDSMNANELAAKALAENAELRKRPTMEEVEAWQQFYGERCGGVPLRDPVFGLESFIEQQRRKEG